MDNEDKFFQNLGVETEKDAPVEEQPVEETPKAEEQTQEQPEETSTTEESSLDNESKPEVEPQTTPKEDTPQSSAPDEDVFEVETDDDLAKFVSDHFDKEVTTEKLKSILEDQQTSSYANDTIKELNDYVAQGGDIKDFMEFKMTDFTQMGDLEIVAKKMQRDYPSLTKDEINRKLTRQFKLDDNRFDEEEIEEGKLDLKLAAEDSRKYFNELQSKYATPLQTKVEKAAEQPQQPEFSEEEVKQFQNQMQQSVNNLKSFDFGGLKYEVNDNLKSKIAQMPTDLGDLFVEGDNFNFDKYNQARAILADPEGFVKTLMAQAETNAIQSIKEKRNNTTLEPEAQNPNANIDTKKNAESLINAFMGKKNYSF